MTATPHPAATHHLPWFITAPGQTDYLYVATAIVLVLAIFLIGVVFFMLHSLPERLGHKKLQFEVVAVLALISLFTHIHLFWVIALILALIDIPDFLAPLRRIASGVEKLSDNRPASSDHSGAAQPSYKRAEEKVTSDA
ncbi:hypothetical protein [Pseudorhodoplanes sp.]|uniref:hypothetical protein n=1 Tax=Pseudorhodoplanes sp. TaxID=1934341 RepID=UPI0039C8E87B